MARDAKLVLTYTNTAASLPVLQISNSATSPATTTSGTVVISGTAGQYGKGSTNALNVGGFRNMLADRAQFIAGGDATAIASDPAISGNMGQEWYVRAVVSQTSLVVGAGSSISILVEAASDSGSGTAGTDWTPISAGVALTTAFTGSKLIAAQITETAKPWVRFVVQVLHGGTASSGSVNISNVGLVLGRDMAIHAQTL
jgi:hypothetical protein